jgi:hypothetical protein
MAEEEGQQIIDEKGLLDLAWERQQTKVCFGKMTKLFCTLCSNSTVVLAR